MNIYKYLSILQCSNLAKTVENINQSYRLRLYWDNDANVIQVFADSTYKGNLNLYNYYYPNITGICIIISSPDCMSATL